MTSTHKLIADGKTQKINFRDAEQHLKCSLKHQFDQKLKRNETIALHKALDQTFSHAALKLLVGGLPSKRTLQNYLERNFTPLTSLPDQVKQGCLEKRGYPLIGKFHQAVTNLLRSYTQRVGPYEAVYSAYGAEISIGVPLVITRKTDSRITPSRFVVIDYTTPTSSWNSFSRLWACMLHETLVLKGASTSEVGILYLHSGKLIVPTPNRNSLTRQSAESLCANIAADLVYPSYGGHCFKCPYQQECSEAISL